MPDGLPLISIIIVNYDTPDLTTQCLQSLQQLVHEGFEYNILVVDNGSQKPYKIPKKISDSKKTKAKEVKLIRTEANIGFTGGNNLGMSHAVKYYNSDYFLLLNSDTTVDPEFLQKLFLCIQGERRGLATSKIYFEKGCEFYPESYNKEELGRIIWFAGGTIDWPNLMAFHRGVDEVDYGQFDHLTKTDFATGCCMLIKREVIEKIGILDKRYFLYLEDVDFSVRAVEKGYGIVFCPESVVYHKNAGSTGGSGSPIHFYYQTRNRLLFFLKHGRLRSKITAFRFWLRLMFSKNSVERKVALDYLLKRYGKQPVV